MSHESFFALDQVLNSSWPWPKGVSRVFMPDSALVRTAVKRTCTTELTTLLRFVSLFSAICPQGGVFVDSGANEGAWSLIAAAHGCRAVAIEPQPFCAKIIHASAKRSGFARSVDLHTKTFSDDKEAKRPCVPNDICKGTATYAGGRVTDIRNSSFVAPTDECTLIPFVALDDLFESSSAPNAIDLWHLDVEGSELVALRSARRLLREGRIKRLMIEVDSKQRWRLNLKRKITIDETLAEVRDLLDGWRCFSACDGWPYTFPVHFHWGGGWQCSDAFCIAPGVDEPTR